MPKGLQGFQKGHIQYSFKTMFKKGYKPWNKNLTKEIDDRVKKSAANNSESHKGQISPMKDKHHTNESRNKISESKYKAGKEVDKILTKEFLIENYINKKLARHRISKMVPCSDNTVGKFLTKFNIVQRSIKESMNYVDLVERGRRNSLALKGKRCWVVNQKTLHSMIIWKKDKQEYFKNGYILGRSPCCELNKQFSLYMLSEYNLWRKSVFIRDYYTCKDCGQVGGKLEVHHIKKVSILIREFFQQYSQFSLLEDKETLVRLAISYEPFWDIGNGKTLCKRCHGKTRRKVLG